jgi:hypothetical protein
MCKPHVLMAFTGYLPGILQWGRAVYVQRVENQK